MLLETRGVPAGWRVAPLGNVATMSQGGTPPKSQPQYWDGDIPFVTGADLTRFRVGRQNARSFLTTEGALLRRHGGL